MIIVKDESTLDEALELLQSEEVVHYSDRYEFRTLRFPVVLGAKCSAALTRGEIALVAPLGEEMSEYTQMWRAFKRERDAMEKTRAKTWIREHPEEVKIMVRRMRLVK